MKIPQEQQTQTALENIDNILLFDKTKVDKKEEAGITFTLLESTEMPIAKIKKLESFKLDDSWVNTLKTAPKQYSLYKGNAHKITVNNMHQLKQLIETSFDIGCPLGHLAGISGLNEHDKIKILSKNDLNKGFAKSLVEGRATEFQNEFTSRTIDKFHFHRDKIGIVCLDVDFYDGVELSKNDVLQKVHGLIPELIGTQLLIKPSTSSSLYGAETKKCHPLVSSNGEKYKTDQYGLTVFNENSGWHILIPINLKDVKLLRDVLEYRMLTSDVDGMAYARFDPETLSITVKHFIDLALFNEVQMFYFGAAFDDSATQKSVFQDFSEMEVVDTSDGDSIALDCSKLKKLSKSEKELIKTERTRLKSDKQASIKDYDELTKARYAENLYRDTKFSNKHARNLAIKSAVNARSAALKSGSLGLDFLLLVQTKKGMPVEVRVQTIIENPELYHDMKCAPPFDRYYIPGGGQSEEPDFSRTLIKTAGGNPVVTTLAHGKQSWSLEKIRPKIYYSDEKIFNTIDETVKVLAKDPSFFNYGGLLYHIESTGSKNTIRQFNPKLTGYQISKSCEFYKKNMETGEEKSVSLFNDSQFNNSVRARLDTVDFKELRAISPLPYMNSFGDVIQTEGYDKHTKVFCDIHNISVPENDKVFSIEEIKTDLLTILKPFSEFNFADEDSVANCIKNILLTAQRTQTMASAVFLFKADMVVSFGNGDGKTLYELTQMALMPEGKTSVIGFNKLISQEGSRHFDTVNLKRKWKLLIDNVPDGKKLQGTFLPEHITSKTVDIRKYHTQEMVEAPNVLALALTGAGTQYEYDMRRRGEGIYIKPSKVIDHKFNPITLATAMRTEIMEASLRLFKACCQLNPSWAPVELLPEDDFKNINRHKLHDKAIKLNENSKYLSRLKEYESIKFRQESFELECALIGEPVAFLGHLFYEDEDIPQFGFPGVNVNKDMKAVQKTDSDGPKVMFDDFIKIMCICYKGGSVKKRGGEIIKMLKNAPVDAEGCNNLSRPWIGCTTFYDYLTKYYKGNFHSTRPFTNTVAQVFRDDWELKINGTVWRFFADPNPVESDKVKGKRYVLESH